MLHCYRFSSQKATASSSQPSATVPVPTPNPWGRPRNTSIWAGVPLARITPDAYDQLKELTRGKTISEDVIQNFVNSLEDLSDEDKQTLLTLSPQSYIGFAPKLTLDEIDKIDELESTKNQI